VSKVRAGADVTEPASPAPGGSRARALAGGARAPRRVHAFTVWVVLGVLVGTAVLVAVTFAVHDNNEDRLLRQRAHEVAAVAAGGVANLQSPLASGAVLAETANGSPAPFMTLMTPIVQTGQPFVSASLWPKGTATSAPIVVAGKAPLLADEAPATVRAFLDGATGRSTFSVRSLLDRRQRRLGYAFAAGPGARYVVYAEASLPAHRRARIASDSAFSDLDYAIYLGRDQRPGALLASNSGHAVPASARQASSVVPFGDSHLLLVVSPRSELGGGLLAALPWILLGLGLVVAVVAGVLTEYLIRRREHAEVLASRLETVADENRRLYTEQREVAETLQRSLLPQELPTVAGLEVAARYEAGVAGTEVGGDWYDLLPLSSRRLLFSVGDVSGRGIEAAATMASLRYSMRAYALEGTAPADILYKLSLLMNVARNELFATVVCGLIDVEEATMVVARAGHPDLLVVEPSGSRFLDAPLGPAIGLFRGRQYESMTVALTEGTTFVAFTDGLVERRNEHLDVGLERLRAASSPGADLGALVDELVEQVAPDSADDIAVLALHWRGQRASSATDGNGAEQAARGAGAAAGFRGAASGQLREGPRAGKDARTEPTSMEMIETHLPSSTESPLLARAFLRATLETWKLDGLGEITELLASELVSNVVVHVGSPMTLRITRHPSAIRVDVEDPSSVLPELRHPGIDEERGRGVLFVSELATDWGAERTEGGKTVWFEIDTSTATAEAHES
jgi:serine phosphatase RsbU (regulator of sigma subunit)